MVCVGLLVCAGISFLDLIPRLLLHILPIPPGSRPRAAGRAGPGATGRGPRALAPGLRAHRPPQHATSRPTSPSRRPKAFTGRVYAVHDTWSALCLLDLFTNYTSSLSRASALRFILPRPNSADSAALCTQHVHVHVHVVVHIAKHPAR